MNALAQNIVRDCIICSSPNHESVFTYTYDFLTKVRWSDPESIAKKGWSEDTVSTIVRCTDCGCFYLRDVVHPIPDSEKRGNSPSDNRKIDRNLQHFAHIYREQSRPRAYAKRARDTSVAVNLLQIASARLRHEIKVLDFGAGLGGTSSAFRGLGVHDVVAFDLAYRADRQEIYDQFCYSGIHCSNSKSDAEKYAPFNLVVCQAVIEHVLDPLDELNWIFEQMSPGGLLYISNPLMDLTKELEALKSAEKISAKDAISHYHPRHYNYMLPKHFENLLASVGFKILPAVFTYNPGPLYSGSAGFFFAQNCKSITRFLLNLAGLSPRRQDYLVEKPLPADS